MGIIKPKNGLNLRYSAYDTPKENWLLMQNVDQSPDDDFFQIHGDTKYHGNSIGDNAPTHIMPYYNSDTNNNHVLVAVDDKIMKKIEGSNEFEELYSGLKPNLIKSHILIANVLFIAHPDGLLEYDGVTVSKVNDGPKLSYILFSLETNRAFGILAETPLVLAYTDDVSTTGGVPVLWNVLNLQAIPPTAGDKLELLDIMSGRLILVLSNSIYIQYIQGSPTQWRFEKAETVMGCKALKTWKRVGDKRWFLGFSSHYGTGVYEFNGRSCRLLSYDVDPILSRINKNRFRESCAELIKNQYRLSFALDASIENNTTLHFDTIKYNSKTESPNIYGPHTYGFNCTAILNADEFSGEFLMGSKYKSKAWIYKEDDVTTRHGDPMRDDGDLIPAKLVSGFISEESLEDGVADKTWVKRFGRCRMEYPPMGTWVSKIDLFTDFDEEINVSYSAYMDGNNSSIESFILGETPIDQYNLQTDQHLEFLRGVSLQVQISNYTLNTRLGFSKFLYDVKIRHRDKQCRRIR